MTGRLHSIQSLGTLDGPGVRTVVFLQGCPLRCAYCHNPDTWNPDGGSEITPEELLDKLLRYKPYYKQRGGVTFSGGEPLMQAAFVRQTAGLCRKNGIHVAMDTSGCIWNAEVASLLDVVNLLLLDIKMPTEAAYRKLTGGSLRQTMQFLEQAQRRGIAVWIRHVVVPGLNDHADAVLSVKALVKPYTCVEKIELLPFRKLCLEKYRQMGISFPLADTGEMDGELLKRLQQLIEN